MPARSFCAWEHPPLCLRGRFAWAPKAEQLCTSNPYPFSSLFASLCLVLSSVGLVFVMAHQESCLLVCELVVVISIRKREREKEECRQGRGSNFTCALLLL